MCQNSCDIDDWEEEYDREIQIEREKFENLNQHSMVPGGKSQMEARLEKPSQKTVSRVSIPSSNDKKKLDTAINDSISFYEKKKLLEANEMELFEDLLGDDSCAKDKPKQSDNFSMSNAWNTSLQEDTLGEISLNSVAACEKTARVIRKKLHQTLPAESVVLKKFLEITVAAALTRMTFQDKKSFSNHISSISANRIAELEPSLGKKESETKLKKVNSESEIVQGNKLPLSKKTDFFSLDTIGEAEASALYLASEIETSSVKSIGVLRLLKVLTEEFFKHLCLKDVKLIENQVNAYLTREKADICSRMTKNKKFNTNKNIMARQYRDEYDMVYGTMDRDSADEYDEENYDDDEEPYEVGIYKAPIHGEEETCSKIPCEEKAGKDKSIDELETHLSKPSDVESESAEDGESESAEDEESESAEDEERESAEDEESEPVDHVKVSGDLSKNSDMRKA